MNSKAGLIYFALNFTSDQRIEIYDKKIKHISSKFENLRNDFATVIKSAAFCNFICYIMCWCDWSNFYFEGVSKQTTIPLGNAACSLKL